MFGEARLQQLREEAAHERLREAAARVGGPPGSLDPLMLWHEHNAGDGEGRGEVSLLGDQPGVAALDCRVGGTTTCGQGGGRAGSLGLAAGGSKGAVEAEAAADGGLLCRCVSFLVYRS